MNSRLIIKNFLVFKDIDIELSKYNIFTGVNGSGKTLMLRLINFLNKIPDYIIRFSSAKYNGYFAKKDGEESIMRDFLSEFNLCYRPLAHDFEIIYKFNDKFTIKFYNPSKNLKVKFIEYKDFQDKCNCVNIFYDENRNKNVRLDKLDDKVLINSLNNYVAKENIYINLYYDLPELWLYPAKLEEVIYKIIETANKLNNRNVYITTNQEYVLTVINLLITAYDVRERQNIITNDLLIKFEEVRAYHFREKGFISMIDEEYRMIYPDDMCEVNQKHGDLFSKIINFLEYREKGIK